MSASGRGRGRGRGRGGFTAGTGPAGFNEINFATLIPQTPTALFPEIGLIPPRPVTDEEFEILEIGREFKRHMMSSAYWLESLMAEKVGDDKLQRYSDKYRPKGTGRKPLTSIPTDAKFFPAELLPVINSSRKPLKRKKARTDVDFLALDELEKEEYLDNENVENENDHDENSDYENNVWDQDDAYDYSDDDDDYTKSYFDNGERDDDDAGEEAGGTY